MSDPRGKRVLFMSISAVPAHRDQSFEVNNSQFYSLSSSHGNHKLIAFLIYPPPYTVSASPFRTPSVRCRNCEPRITSRRIWPPADHQLQSPKNRLIPPQERLWSCHCCSNHTSIWRRHPAADLRRNKRPLLLKSTAFHKARIRRLLGSRLLPRKSLSEDIHSRCVSPVSRVLCWRRWFRRSSPRLLSRVLELTNRRTPSLPPRD